MNYRPVDPAHRQNCVHFRQIRRVKSVKNSAVNVFDGIPVGEDEDHLFEEYLNSHDYAPGSRRGYVLDLRKFAKWFTKANGERFVVGRVTTRDITDFKMHLRRDRGQAVPTINRNLTTIRNSSDGWPNMVMSPPIPASRSRN